MSELVKALSLLAPLWGEIASKSGVPGVSISIFHQGEAVMRHNYGHRDLENLLPTTSDTIFPLGSLSKAFTAMLYGSLVADGITDWNSPIRHAIPEFRSEAAEVERLASAADLLARRTGIPGGETLYFHAEPLLNDSDIVPTFASLHPVQPFRAQMQYNNLGYALVAMAMSRKTGQSYHELLKRRLLDPLNLTRTGLGFDPRNTEDIAKRYVVTEDMEAVENSRSFFRPGSSMIASEGVWSSLNDLLGLYLRVAREAIQPNAQSPIKALVPVISG